MKAQELYDLRSAFEFCSGNDLSEFFAETVGEPSPSGEMEVPEALAREFISESLAQMGQNNGGLDNLYSAPELAALLSICRV